MFGLPDTMCWRAELSCGTVAVLGSSGPDDTPHGVIICPDHGGQMVSIVAVKRWDIVRAEQLAARTAGEG